MNSAACVCICLQIRGGKRRLHSHTTLPGNWLVSSDCELFCCWSINLDCDWNWLKNVYFNWLHPLWNFSVVCARTEQTTAPSRAVVKPSNLCKQSTYDSHRRCTTVQEGLKIIIWSFDWAQHFEPTSHLVKENRWSSVSTLWRRGRH